MVSVVSCSPSPDSHRIEDMTCRHDLPLTSRTCALIGGKAPHGASFLPLWVWLPFELRYHLFPRSKAPTCMATKSSIAVHGWGLGLKVAKFTYTQVSPMSQPHSVPQHPSLQYTVLHVQMPEYYSCATQRTSLLPQTEVKHTAQINALGGQL